LGDNLAQKKEKEGMPAVTNAFTCKYQTGNTVLDGIVFENTLVFEVIS
jgi:hypothetical protein